MTLIDWVLYVYLCGASISALLHIGAVLASVEAINDRLDETHAEVGYGKRWHGWLFIAIGIVVLAIAWPYAVWQLR